MKRKIPLTVFLLIASVMRILAEPSGRGYDPDALELDLPEGNEVLIGLIIAVITIPIGFLISFLCKKEDDSDIVSLPGCIASLFIGGGFVCLLPLVVWLFTIIGAIVEIGYLLMLVIGIIGLIGHLISKGK